ncbi:MAG TPA: DUF1697 domain-containing protein, partial [Acidimicrobiales bacterium]|nr:DUF1697 domain-containing protein [Acidimicrobiales bacterium]
TDQKCDDVQTYIQSGNVVFSSKRALGASFTKAIEEAITEKSGLRVDVLIRTRKELSEILRDNPFPPSTHQHVHVVFLKGELSSSTADSLNRSEGEEYNLGKRVIYLHLPNGFGRAKLPPLVARLEPTSTVRNLRTVQKLLDLAST